MKLHLPKMLTAALLAAATVITTSATAQAETAPGYSGLILTWNNTYKDNDLAFGNYRVTEYDPTTGQFTDKNDQRAGWTNPTQGLIGTNNTAVHNTLRFAASEYGQSKKTPIFTFTPLVLAGIIVDEGARGFSFGTNDTTSDRNIYLGNNNSTAAYSSINEDFAINKNHGGGKVYLRGTQTIDVASGKTYTITSNNGFDISGAITLQGGGTLALNGAVTLANTIVNNSSTVAFGGAVSLSDSLSGFDSQEQGTYVDYRGAASADGNGYYQGTTIYTIVKGGTASGLTSVTHGGETYQVTDGKITVGSADATDWTTYHLRTSGASVNVGTELGNNDQLVKVIQGAGTTVDMGGATLATLEGATNGEAMKLAGTGIVSALVKSGVLDMQSDASVTVPNLNVTSNMGTYSTGAGQLVIDTVTTNNSGVIEFDSATKLTTVHLTGGTVTFGGTGLHEVTTLGLSQTGTQISTVNVEAGAELHIVGTAVAYDHDTRFSGSFSLSHWSAANVVNVAGTLISDVVVSSCDGTGTINVLEGGRLEMRDGLNRGNYNDNAITINVANGATLAAGTTYNTEQTKDSDTMVVTLADGATLEAYYKDAATETTIVKSMTLGNVTVKTGDAGHTLTLSGNLTADGTIAQTGEGALVLAGTVVIDGNTSGLTEKYIGGETAGDVNGFYNASGTFAVYTGDHVTIGQDAHITYGGVDVKEAMEDGVYTLQETTDYSVFYVNQGTEKVSTAKEGEGMQNIVLAANTGLTVDDNFESAHISVASGTANVEISEDKVLSGTARNMVLHGEGTYALNNNTAVLGNGVTLSNDDWAGIVRLTNLSKADGNTPWISTLAKGESWVEFINFTGYDHAWAHTYEPGGVTANIILTDDADHHAAWNLTSCAGTMFTMILAGDVKGDGTFKTSGGSNTQSQAIEFRGDIFGWTGAFVADAPGTRQVVFSNDATDVQASITRQGAGALELVVNNGATFSKEVNVSSTTLNGAATFAADSSLGAVTINNGGGLTVGEDATVNTTSVTANGETTTMSGAGTLVLPQAIALTAGELTISGVYDVNALALVGETTYEGGVNAGNGFATEKGSVTVVDRAAEGTTLTVAGATVVRGGHTFSLENDGTANIDSPNNAIFRITTLSESVTTAKSREGQGVALASIQVDAGATLDVDKDINLSLLAAASAGTLNIGTGIVVTVDATAPAVKLTGSGNYVLANNTATLGAAALEEGWDGIVTVSGVSFNGNFDTVCAELATDDSWIELKGTKGYLNASGKRTYTYGTNLILSRGEDGWAYAQNNGNDQSVLKFTGTIKGEGNLGRSEGKGSTYTYEFTGNIRDWTGQFISNNIDDRYTLFKVSGDATVVAATLVNNREGDKSDFRVEVNTNAEFTSTVQATSLAVNAGMTATFDQAVDIAKGITVGAGATLYMNGGGSIAQAITSASTVSLTNVALSDAFQAQEGGEKQYFVESTANYYLGTAYEYLTVVTGEGAANATGTGLTWGGQEALTMAEGQVKVSDHGTAAYDTLFIGQDTTTAEIAQYENIESLANIVVKNGKLTVAQGDLQQPVDITVSEYGTISGDVDPGEVGIAAGATAEFTKPVDTEYISFTAAEEDTVKVINNGETATKYDTAAMTNDDLTVEAKTLELLVDGEYVSVSNKLHVDEIVNVQLGGILLLDNEDSMELKSMTIGDYAVVGVYSDAQAAQEGTVTITESLVAGHGTLYADLEMASGSSLDVSGAEGEGLTMGSNVGLNTGDLIAVMQGDESVTDIAVVDAYLRNYFAQGNEYYTLFTGVDDFTINGVLQPKDLVFTDWCHFDYEASSIFSNLIENTYALVYDMDGGIGVGHGTVALKLIPEPATGTLSLLALAALAARRRKH